MTLVGLPDFDRPLGAGQPLAWRGFGRDEWLVAADDLALALRSDVPDLHVGLYRSQSPTRRPEPFGVLDATFRAAYPAEAALEAARHIDPGAQVLRALPTGGTIEIWSTVGEAGDSDADALSLTGPQALMRLAADRLRLSQRLSPQAASLFAQAVEDGQMPLKAALVLRYEGIAPRVPLTAVCDPRAVLEALSARLEDGRIAHASLAVLLEELLPGLPIELVGIETEGEKARLAAALADRLALRFADLLDSPDGTLRFVAPESIAIARFSVDLSQPVKSVRWVSLESDPFAALRGADAAGRHRHVSRTEVPPIPTGAHRVQVYANLALTLIGVERLGVVLRAPPNPPARPHPISTTLLFEEGMADQQCDIALAPGEDFALTAHGFAILSDDAGVHRVEGPARPVSAAGALFLAPQDFGFNAYRVTATEAALEVAQLDVAASFLRDGRPVRVTKQLLLHDPGLDLAVPLGAAQASLKVVATRGGSEQRIDLGERALGDLVLDVDALPGFGAHEVRLSCKVPEDAPPVAIDIVAQGRRFDAEAIQTFAFTAQQGERVWRYFAADPFASGFRWRYHTSASVIAEGWIDSPVTARLTIDPSLAPQGEARPRGMVEAIPPRKTVSLAVDFGNGVTKTYREMEVPEEASLHNVLSEAANWQPPLACKVVNLFTDRGGTQRNVLGSVDGVAGALRDEGVWQVVLDGEPFDLSLPGPWSHGKFPEPGPVPPGASIELARPPA